MSDIRKDNRIVMTLDAGGTNMVFGAMKGGEFCCEPITLPSNADNLDRCLGTMVTGFKKIKEELGEEKPAAISFCFPGPADYPDGIIGGYLPNFPSFRDGVALGPFLEDTFGIPVFINNDGDLYAYGEALGGVLPEINERLAKAGSAKRYHNLIGYTFGTGLGIGTVINGELNRGDNSCVETFCLKHPDMPDIIVEDGASIRARHGMRFQLGPLRQELRGPVQRDRKPLVNHFQKSAFCRPVRRSRAAFLRTSTQILQGSSAKSSKAPLHFRQDCATMKNINSFFLFLKKWQNG